MAGISESSYNSKRQKSSLKVKQKGEIIPGKGKDEEKKSIPKLLPAGSLGKARMHYGIRLHLSGLIQ